MISCVPSYPPNSLLITPPAMGHRQFPGLSNWYSSGSRHSMATRTYLSSLFFYFERLRIGQPFKSGDRRAYAGPSSVPAPAPFTLRIQRRTRLRSLICPY
ncbi:hypothetical protein EMCG_06721 [[Emmonsia] crescens]|uniref:Uncharacterized protein n=1 Tax=[Emmonsia] crescens TaxID=73230 RepID=A0A0G2JBK9_9EURO|nr:hypothetical protein EMCG_06721 [Emmonsia crescens UAMH 3008]